jgi:glycerol uptake facilitator-like aquaporin
MLQSYFVEFFGTMFFVYIILATGNPLAIGAALALVVLLTSSISGGYINPVITLVMSAAGQLPSSEVIPYCLAQIFGGLIALEIYKHVNAYTTRTVPTPMGGKK